MPHILLLLWNLVWVKPYTLLYHIYVSLCEIFPIIFNIKLGDDRKRFREITESKPSKRFTLLRLQNFWLLTIRDVRDKACWYPMLVFVGNHMILSRELVSKNEVNTVFFLHLALNSFHKRFSEMYFTSRYFPRPALIGRFGSPLG